MGVCYGENISMNLECYNSILHLTLIYKRACQNKNVFNFWLVGQAVSSNMYKITDWMSEEEEDDDEDWKVTIFDLICEHVFFYLCSALWFRAYHSRIKVFVHVKISKMVTSRTQKFNSYDSDGKRYMSKIYHCTRMKSLLVLYWIFHKTAKIISANLLNKKNAAIFSMSIIP